MPFEIPQQTEIPAILFIATLFQHPANRDAVLQVVSTRWGPLAPLTLEYPFEFSNYYVPEMGRGLIRSFHFFVHPIVPWKLREVKLGMLELERQSARDEGGQLHRTINLDPGYLTHYQVVLATRKNYNHRIPLGSGVFVEMEYIISGKSWKTLPWTYPDYRTEVVRELFLSARNRLLLQRGL